MSNPLIERYYFLVLLAILGLSSGSCCQLSPMARDTPKRPTVKSSWREFHLTVGVMGFGPLVLNKGESTENEWLGVKIMDFIPRSCPSFLSHSPEQPKAVFQFYKPADHQILCEVALPGPGNISIDRDEMCGNKTGISVVGINGINAKEGWVSFDLRK